MFLCAGNDLPNLEFEAIAHFRSTAASQTGVEWKRMHVTLSQDCSSLTLHQIAPADCGGQRIAVSAVALTLGPEHQFSRHNVKVDEDEELGLEDKHAPAPYRVVLCNPQAAAPSVFCVESTEEADRWESTLRAAVGTLRRPQWQPDTAANSCLNCSKEFKLWRRRHHCRCCGYVFCSDCVADKEKLISMNYTDRVRICQQCISRRNDDQAQTVIVNPYLAWVRTQLQIQPVNGTGTHRPAKLSSVMRGSKLSISRGFATVNGDWATASNVDSEPRPSDQSCDSAIAALCIRSMAAAGSARPTRLSDDQSMRSTMTSIEDTLNETQIRQVLEACEQIETDCNGRNRENAPSTLQSPTNAWCGVSQVR